MIDGVDPYTLPSGSWTKDEASFPAVSYPDSVNYLIFGKSFYSMEDMKAWKSLEAYNQLTSGWICDLSVFAYMSPVPHSAGQSRIFVRCPASRKMRRMSRIFRKLYYFFPVADYSTFLHRNATK